MKQFLKPDGTVNVTALEALEEALNAVTDNYGKLMDRILQKGFQPGFRCTHSGLILPADYVKNWGRLYGIGYGPSPVSEVLDTDYDARLPEITNDIVDESQIMHPVQVSGAQVDFLMLSPDDIASGVYSEAVMEKDDPFMRRRSKIVRERQLVNPRGRIKFFAMKLGGVK